MSDIPLSRFSVGGIPNDDAGEPASRQDSAKQARRSSSGSEQGGALAALKRRLAPTRLKPAGPQTGTSSKQAGKKVLIQPIQPLQPGDSAVDPSTASAAESSVQSPPESLPVDAMPTQPLAVPHVRPRASLPFRVPSRPSPSVAMGIAQASTTALPQSSMLIETAAIDLPSEWPNPAKGKMRYRPVERAALRLMDGVWRRKDPGNVHLRRTGHSYQASFDWTLADIANIPGGLAESASDCHTHPVGYDHRYGKTFIDLLRNSSPASFILVGSIPQHCGSSHYSDVNAMALRMTNAARMDSRAAKTFMGLHTRYKEWLKRGNRVEAEKELRLLARADLSFTGLDPSKPGTVEYMRKTLLHNPGVFVSAGELTGDKEMVKKQLGRNAFTFGDWETLRTLSFAQECGLLVLIHNDWGDHGLHPDDMRPEAVTTAYENFERLIDVMAGYPDANIILAHCGIGRFVRPDSELVEVDAPAVMGMRNGQRVMIRPAEKLQVPKHIALMYKAIERAPHLKFDISWNDVGDAFVTDPALRKGLVEFIIRNQDRVLFGSDTVKPVNEGQYNQALTLMSPIIADVARIDKEAAWKLIRGNYEATILKAGSAVREWTESELNAQRFNPSTPAIERSRIRARISGMDNMLIARAPKRQEISAQARRNFDAWHGELMKRPLLVRPDTVSEPRPRQPGLPRPTQLVPMGPETAYEHIARRLPGPQTQTWRQNDSSEYGHGTVHGNDYDDPKAVAAAAAIGGGLGVAAFAGVDAVASEANAAIQHAGNSLIARDFRMVNPAAFILRALLVAMKTAYGEGMRLKWEEIFEQGHVTTKDLNIFMDRLAKLGPSFKVPADRIDKVAMLTEQFRANMQRLYDMPLSSFATIASDPRQGVTDADRQKRKFDVIMGEVGRYQINVDRALGRQASSINALDPRAVWGQAYRVGVAASYILNVASNLQYMMAGHHGSGTGSVVEMAVQVSFGIANAAMLLNTLGGIAGGTQKMNLETYGKSPLRWGAAAGNALFTATGAPWMLSEFTSDNLALPENVSSTADLVGHVAPAVVKAMLDVGFSAGTGFITENELRRNMRHRMKRPADQAAPTYWMSAALIVRELIQLFRP